MSNAISTYKTFLMYKASSSATTYTQLVEIKEFPDLLAAPEPLDKTTLAEGMRTYINGIRDTGGSLQFTANYNLADFATLDAMVDTEYSLSVWFGGTESGGTVTPTGSDGKFDFTGYVVPGVAGGGVNEVVNMTVNVFPTSVIEQTAS